MSFNDFGLIATAALVVLGVVLEGLHDFTAKGRRPMIPKIAFAILVLGLCGEIFFEARLTKEAADTRLKAADLERQLAWRTINWAQKAELVSELKRFAGQRIDIFTYVGDPEADALGWKLYDVFKSAGLDPSTPSRVTGLSKLIYGIQVQVGSTQQTLSGALVRCLALTPEAKKMAEVLVEGLRRTQLPPIDGPVQMLPPELDLGTTPMSEAPIRVMVGIKPR